MRPELEGDQGGGRGRAPVHLSGTLTATELCVGVGLSGPARPWLRQSPSPVPAGVRWRPLVQSRPGAVSTGSWRDNSQPASWRSIKPGPWRKPGGHLAVGSSSCSSRQGPCAGAHHRREDTALPDLDFPFWKQRHIPPKGKCRQPSPSAATSRQGADSKAPLFSGYSEGNLTVCTKCQRAGSPRTPGGGGGGADDNSVSDPLDFAPSCLQPPHLYTSPPATLTSPLRLFSDRTYAVPIFQPRWVTL